MTHSASMPIFSTLKRIERSYHSTVGMHTVATWSTYSLQPVRWNDGRVTMHLSRTDYVNGQTQWSGAQFGVTDTQRMLGEFGIAFEL